MVWQLGLGEQFLMQVEIILLQQEKLEGTFLKVGKWKGLEDFCLFYIQFSDELLPKCIRHELGLFALVSC